MHKEVYENKSFCSVDMSCKKYVNRVYSILEVNSQYSHHLSLFIQILDVLIKNIDSCISSAKTSTT